MPQVTVYGEAVQPVPSDKEVEGWINNLVGVFYKPIMVYPGGWEESLPHDLMANIKIERLIQQMAIAQGKEKPGRATIAEACAYLWTATLSALPSSDFFDIYMYCFYQYTQAHNITIPDDFFDREPTLNSYLEGRLNRFLEWIWVGTEKAWRAKHKELVRKKDKKEGGDGSHE